MPLVQKTVGSTTYYSDGINYYLFHPVNVPKDALTELACRELGIPMKPKFSEEESKRLAALAGTGVQNRTKYELLKNGQAVPVPYHVTGHPAIQKGDILLRKVAPPIATGMIKCRTCSSDTPPGKNCRVCGAPL